MFINIPKDGLPQAKPTTELSLNEVELSEELAELHPLLAACTQLHTEIEQLFWIDTVLDKYGTIPALEAFNSNNDGDNRENLRQVIKQKLIQLGQFIIKLIKKAIKLIKEFTVRKTDSRLNDLGELPNKLPVMQEEKLSGVTCLNLIDLVTTCSWITEHFKVHLSSTFPKLGTAATITQVRDAYIAEFNSQVHPEAQVNANCKLKSLPIPIVNGKIREYGYRSLQDLQRADAAIQKVITTAQSVLTNLQNTNAAVERAVRAAENGEDNAKLADSVVIQGAYVYSRIIALDLDQIKRVNYDLSRFIGAAKHIARTKYVSSNA